jgi:glycosyltransferase involved in cell wall biosynthesis
MSSFSYKEGNPDSATGSAETGSSVKRVLIITYYWPPSGGAGVQRWLKFARYLPEFGWKPVILTVDSSMAAYPFVDQSLASDIPDELEVYKTPATDYFAFYKKDKSKIPSAGFATGPDKSLKGKLMRFARGNFFIPDPRKGWNKFAFRKACELIDSQNIKHVITTSPPHSTQLIGLSIKKKYPGIHWIADLRDPWTDIYYYSEFYPTPVSKSIDSSYEKKVLRESDRIITVGESLKDLFSKKLKGSEKKIDIITNGYDEADFNYENIYSPGIFTITYVGTLSDIYPLQSFIGALKSYEEKGNKFLLRFIGSVSPLQKEFIKKEISTASLEFIPYVNHQTAIKYMLESSVLLLIIPDHESNKSIITGKIFEYIASGKPVICIAPEDGDAASIIKSAGAGEVFGYNNEKGLFAYLINADIKYAGHTGNRSMYSRKNLTGKLTDILNTIKN